MLPETLHWFKWEAYTTWLSGFALMVVLYYLNADTYLIDKSVADLSTGEAVAISIGLLAAAWIVYDAALPRARVATAPPGSAAARARSRSPPGASATCSARARSISRSAR